MNSRLGTEKSRKCKTCGNTEQRHKLCMKFIPIEDETDTQKTIRLMKKLKEKKGFCDNCIRMKEFCTCKKEKKGCGKPDPNDRETKCGNYGYLCPECSNQSPQEDILRRRSKTTFDKQPEETQSPSTNSIIQGNNQSQKREEGSTPSLEECHRVPSSLDDSRCSSGDNSPQSGLESVKKIESVSEDTQTLSSKRQLGSMSRTWNYPEEDVKDFIKQETDLIEDLEKQLINDFRTSLSIISAKRFIRARIKSLNEDRIKLVGENLI